MDLVLFSCRVKSLVVLIAVWKLISPRIQMVVDFRFSFCDLLFLSFFLLGSSVWLRPIVIALIVGYL